MFLTGRGTLASCPFQEETSDKRVPVVATGLVHLQASWPLSTPSGQDVSLSEESLPESPFVSGRRTLLIFSWLSHYNLLINAIDLCTEFRHVKTT